MSTKIFVMTHKKFQEPKEACYVPLHVGKAVAEPLGYRGDDTGENISAKNQYYGELTGLYWVAHNEMEADYVGLCHYRRFFVGDDGHLLTENEYENILGTYDVMLARPVYYETSYYEVYRQAHHIRDLDVTQEVLAQLYPDDAAVFREIIQGNKVYSCNMLVSTREHVAAYARWLFSIFDEVEKRIDVESYDAYHKRVFGFLSEQLLYVWVKSRGLSVYEAQVGLTGEKAETTELKQKLRGLVGQGTAQSLADALSLFRETMKQRPDLMLGGSDLAGELEDMFRVIFICDGEWKQGGRSMLHITTDLDMLVRHYRLMGVIAGHIVSDTASGEERAYFRDAMPSPLFMQIMINNAPALQSRAAELYSAAGL